ncbi:hypothetical protein LCGC14_2696830, partial [marine sediment metagenome]
MFDYMNKDIIMAHISVVCFHVIS